VDSLIGPFLTQFPFIGVILFLFHKFKQAQDEARDRFISYMRDRDAELRDSLSCIGESHEGVGKEIKGLAISVAKLETRLGAKS
jgi:hypothetical protein